MQFPCYYWFLPFPFQHVRGIKYPSFSRPRNSGATKSKEHAKELYKEILKRCPKGDYAEKSKERLKALSAIEKNINRSEEGYVSFYPFGIRKKQEM